ncbi:hypothetical protein [Paraflavitalea sp. CAU 1676]|uniref:hypothetical protein n=1 Tax=Paraflavitalea sp. CAU 1676 TaxID=3032598 RepID=UPI0023D9B202|nr:hypothetical protein [Paraflavitalea sp. CAU 1676]MDF2191923.1 hypothetical protein [Paraflavitalea sp. CAU 1676]
MKGTHNRTSVVALGVVCLALLATACGKKDTPAQDGKIEIVPKVSGVGTPTGAATTKVIGAAGGFVTSADHSVTITIPSGALSANTTIGIQPIINTNVGGKGTAYRLTPHGQQFAKPVEIAMAYLPFKDSMAFPLTAVLSFQGDDGVWQMPSGSVVDTTAKVVEYSTTHFSDWAIMERVSLKPVTATLGEGEKLNIVALIYNAVPNPCNCMDDLLQPLPPRGNPYPVGEPAALPVRYIKNWKLVGPGSIDRTTGNSVEYKAPASIPGFTTATVVMQLNGDDQGKYLLLSNIKLTSESWIEMSVAGGAKVMHPATPAVKSGDTYILSGGDEGIGNYIMMKWDGGVGTHAWELGNGNSWHYIKPGMTYGSRWIDISIPERPEKVSGGGVTVTRISGGWIEGTFTVSRAGYDDFTVTTSASGSFKAKLIGN